MWNMPESDIGGICSCMDYLQVNMAWMRCIFCLKVATYSLIILFVLGFLESVKNSKTWKQGMFFVAWGGKVHSWQLSVITSSDILICVSLSTGQRKWGAMASGTWLVWNSKVVLVLKLMLILNLTGPQELSAAKHPLLKTASGQS